MTDSTESTAASALPPRIAEMQAVLAERFPFSRDIVARTFAAFGRTWAEDCEETLQALFPSPAELAAAVDGYGRFAMSSLRLQAAFERDGAYRAKSYAEAAEQVYFNEGRMVSEYLPGLLLSHFLWPHHYRQLEFFRSFFLRPLQRNDQRRFVEVGVGTGLYSRLALAALPDATGIGYDISPFSKAFALTHAAAFGHGARYQVLLRDVVAAPPTEQTDMLICVEVLEHLEDPPAFLAALRRLLAPGGRAFITAAINAAHTDHIYLYRSAAEVETQLTAAGFFPEQCLSGAAYLPLRPGAPVPVAAAFIVS